MKWRKYRERIREEERRTMEEREVHTPQHDDVIILSGEDWSNDDEPEFHLQLGSSRKKWEKLQYCPACRGTRSQSGCK
jgi:hypothetical protein